MSLSTFHGKPACLLSLVWLLVFPLVLPLSAQRYEADYADLIQRELGGRREVAITSGYVDLLNSDYAIEIEFANKWKQAIGQALWYGLQTNRQAGIVLIKRSPKENKYVIQLGSTLQYAGLLQRVRVWVWPDDFSGQATTRSPLKEQVQQENLPMVLYWLTLSTNKRHRPDCRYYKTTKGRICKPTEGIPCKVCGG